MATTYDMSTLLPPEALQEIAQRWGSPAFYAQNYKSNATAERWWYIHLFTGRVPSPEEFYYGTYIEQRGDTRSSELAPLSLLERAIGSFKLYTNGYGAYDDGYAVGSQALTNGALLPEGVTSSDSTYVPVPRNANSDLSWMLDWSFSASRSVKLTKHTYYTALISDASNDLLNDARPTWFMISGSHTLPAMTELTVEHHEVSGQPQARISMPSMAAADKIPTVMGTVGAIGSGADLELSQGYDSISDTVAPVSLRIKCNAV